MWGTYHTDKFRVSAGWSNVWDSVEQCGRHDDLGIQMMLGAGYRQMRGS